MREKKKVNIKYTEPVDYFPKEIRKKHKLGEYSENERPQKIRYQIKSVILGHAVADALGVPVEGFSRDTLKQFPVDEMLGYGTYMMPKGSWSDDTSMSLAALDALTKEDWKWNCIMDNFAAWLSTGEYTPTGKTFDVGKTCKRAILNYSVLKMSADACGCRTEKDNGNGSVMRINPFVLYATLTKLSGTNDGHWLFMGCIKAASELTHAHECSVMGCYIYGYCLSFLLNKATRESLLDGIKFASDDLDCLPEFERFKRIFEPDFATLPAEQIKSSGYVVDTLEAALWCVLTTNDYKSCVLKAVNLGGDADSVAAVAGGLAGALYGYDAIPPQWLDELKRRDYIEQLCDAAADAWGKQKTL